MRFAKPPLSVDDQVELLVRRGMVISDRDRARRYLSHINYYRLRAYWLPFESAPVAGDHRFVSGISFDDVVALYVFDRRLRLVVLDAIERVEVSVRTRWAHTLAMRYGAHAFLQANLFRDPDTYGRCLNGLREEIGRSHETFVEHYRTRYTQPELPPIWAACEAMTTGQLSTWFANLRHRADRKEIAALYRLDEGVLRSFMHHLTHVRNLCAHHSRLWNRRFTFTMRLPQTPRHIAGWFNAAEPRKLYNTLAMLGYLLTIVSPDSSWRPHLVQLIDGCQQAQPAAMGFPGGWRELPPWKSST